MIRLQKIVTSSWWRILLLPSQLARFNEATCLVGEVHVAGMWGQPPASGQWENDTLSPTTHEEPNPVNSHMSLEESFPEIWGEIAVPADIVIDPTAERPL